MHRIKTGILSGFTKWLLATRHSNEMEKESSKAASLQAGEKDLQRRVLTALRGHEHLHRDSSASLTFPDNCMHFYTYS